MIRVYLADSQPEERAALRQLLLDLKIDVVGEASNWPTTVNLAPCSKLNMLLVDWNMLPFDSNAALDSLRAACPDPIVIVLISHHYARHQAALSAGANTFIRRGEIPYRVAEHLNAATKGLLGWSTNMSGTNAADMLTDRQIVARVGERFPVQTQFDLF